MYGTDCGGGIVLRLEARRVRSELGHGFYLCYSYIITKHNFQSIELITEALLDRGYSHTNVDISGRAYRRFEKGQKSWTTLSGSLQYPFISRDIKRLARQKNLANEYVQSLGYAVPKTHLVRRGDAVRRTSFASLQAPLIVKPVDGEGSKGLTRSITTEKELMRGVSNVHQGNSDALVQEQFSGQELRITVINHKIASVFLRDTPQLVGDGKHTLAELLAMENQSRLNIRVPYMSYPQLTKDLVTLPFDAAAVPKAGEVVPLGKSAMISGGASVYNIDKKLHPSYKEIALGMVAGLDAPFLIVDLLVKDYTKPAKDGSYVFLEFNTAPVLKLYYSFRDGMHYDIVPQLADLIEERAAHSS